MRKVYIKPEMEIVAYLHESNLMDHSDTHIGAKGVNFDDEELEEDSKIKIDDIWDD